LVQLVIILTSACDRDTDGRKASLSLFSQFSFKPWLEHDELTGFSVLHLALITF